MGRLERLRERALAWAERDPDPETRDALLRLVDEGDEATLAAHVDGTLEFGTAGLRAEVGPGPRRMNRAVVIRATRGLVDWLQATGEDGGRPVVVGFDARPDSARFARDVVGVVAAAGLPVRWFPEPTPTPLAAYAALRFDACAAVVVTASHNPPSDNGYKVYAGNGAQIVPPTDREIAAAIEAVGAADEVPRVDDVDRHDAVATLGDEVFDAYLDDARAARPAVEGDRSIRIVHTSLHGVGGRFVAAILDDAGFSSVHPVAEQADPDGSFPTVTFPNPEEPGALDLAFEAARARAADVVLANDPDTDRLAVAAPTTGGRWRQLTGNQVGLLLGDHLLAHTSASAPLVCSSIVSSPGLGAVAAVHGARFEQTLTGFKWICNAALELQEREGLDFVFGYEEALGYTVGEVVRDKDGIAATAVMAEFVAWLRAQGRTVDDALRRLAVRDGLWVSHQHSVRREGDAGAREIEDAMTSARSARPDRLADRAVQGVTDYGTGADDRPSYLPAADLVAYHLDGGRALVRPSGTEPKLKVYVDLTTAFGDDDDLDDVEGRLRREADVVARDLVDRLGVA